MKLMCLLEHTLEIPLKASPDLKFPRQVVILSARRPNLPSVKLKCSFAEICNKQTKVVWKICILAKVWGGESGAADGGAHLSDEGSSCSSSIAAAFGLYFHMAPRSGHLVRVKCALLRLGLPWWASLLASVLCPQTVCSQNLQLFIQSTQKSPLKPELHQHHSQAALTTWV